jgi:hypothetical protein
MVERQAVSTDTSAPAASTVRVWQTLQTPDVANNSPRSVGSGRPTVGWGDGSATVAGFAGGAAGAAWACVGSGKAVGVVLVPHAARNNAAVVNKIRVVFIVVSLKEWYGKATRNHTPK